MIKIEITDTYGGEANYSWVNRLEIEDKRQSLRQILKQVRKHFGITCKFRKVYDLNDCIRYNFDKQCVCMFIMWE
jgi:hypothetical protein